jgi:uncharacterized protein YkvS
MINDNLGGYYMKHTAKVKKIGDCVQFSYRKNPSLQLTGYVVRVLTNTIVVEVSDMMEEELIDARQVVVKHGRYHKIARKQVKSKVS